MFKLLFEAQHQAQDVPQQSVNIRLNGVVHPVPKGLTVAAALLYLGCTASRQHPKTKQAQLPYCHMGVCYACLVTINGQTNQRACMTIVEANLAIDVHEDLDFGPAVRGGQLDER